MRLSVLGISFFIAGVIIGCSDVGFQSKPSATCVNFNNGGDQTCTFTPEGNIYTTTFTTGRLDILFVNDNSGSMSREQSKMADAFSGFINSISDFDYQIAMVTTDIENDGGRLLTFVDEDGNTDGEKVLKKGALNIYSKFRGTIQRPETLHCDNNLYAEDECPSFDERGIYAANLAIQSNEAGWLRNGAHTVIIPITDEAQRSRVRWNDELQDWEGALRGSPLEAMDRPETLAANFSSRFATKSLAVHPIIVRPGDNTCLESQDVYFDLQGRPIRNHLSGAYAYLWNEMARATQYGLDLNADGSHRNIVNGTVSSICNSTFYNQLNLIGSYSASNAGDNVIQMQCLPEMEDITVESVRDVNYYVDTNKNQIVFENMPPGLHISVSWVCDNSI